MSEVQESVLEQTKEEIRKQRRRAAHRRWYAKHLEKARQISRESKKSSYWSDPAATRAKMREYRASHPDIVKRAKRNDRINNKERIRKRYKEWADKNREYVREYNRQWRLNNPDRTRAGRKRRYDQLRREIMIAYGTRCACSKCPETMIEFLTIDHIENGKGNPAPRSAGRRGYNFYVQLKKMGFPKKNLQSLCHNCNAGKAIYGTCPHLLINRPLNDIGTLSPEQSTLPSHLPPVSGNAVTDG